MASETAADRSRRWVELAVAAQGNNEPELDIAAYRQLIVEFDSTAATPSHEIERKLITDQIELLEDLLSFATDAKAQLEQRLEREAEADVGLD